MSRHPLIAASGVLVALTALFTWPLCLHPGTSLIGHQDSYFNAWRLAWIAHALPADPRHLFDANIFYPERRTLAYSDAMLVEGILAAPLFWAGVRPVLVHNLALLAGIASSGAGMFVLVRSLTASPRAALVSAVVFALQPYRMDHIMHLELQWAAWIPLSFWALHRTVEERSRRSWRCWLFGSAAGVFVWLQMLSSLYYGVFLAMMAAVFIVLSIATEARARAAWPQLAAGVIVALLLTIPYSEPYRENAAVLGKRSVEEIGQYSAVLSNFLSTPGQNWVWGWTEQWGQPERHLFPGLMAIVLACAAIAHQLLQAAGSHPAQARRVVWIYAALALVAIEMSLGTHGRAYAWLIEHVDALRGLRAPARFAMLAQFGLAVLAGFGFACLEEHAPDSSRMRSALMAGAVLAAALEFQASPVGLMSVSGQVPDVYRVLQRHGRGVIAEFPMANPARLPGPDPQYEFWSTTHWFPLVNGYSGYVSSAYIVTLEAMRGFPDDASIARLRQLDARYVLIHEDLCAPGTFSRQMIDIGRRPELAPLGKYRDWQGWAHVFELRERR